MKGFGFSRYVLGICATGAMLAGCGGSQPPIGVPGAVPTIDALAQARVLAHHIGATQYYQVIYSFTGARDGASPLASLIDVKGVLYGTTAFGGVYSGYYCYTDCGTVFSVTPSGKEKVLHSFGNGADGAIPFASLIDMNGTLYGTTLQGGTDSDGTVFRISTSGREHALYSFELGSGVGGSSDGGYPVASLIDVSGMLYGTTRYGGIYHTGSGPGYYGYGTVFSITTGGTENVLHSFGGLVKGVPDGRFPKASLIDVKGVFYGTTADGGGPGSSSGSFGCNHGCGTVFRATTGGAEKVLHVFTSNGADGTSPWGSLIDVNGTLYGTTEIGGARGDGTVFSISTSGKEKVLYSFGVGSDGMLPHGDLIDVNGTLYGTTEEGGAHNLGTVFSITTSGTEKVLHSFGSGSGDGARPLAGLVDVNGTLYGTTAGGGAHTGCYYGGCGTVFALSL